MNQGLNNDSDTELNIRSLQVFVDEDGNPVDVIYANEFAFKYANHPYYSKYNKNLLDNNI